MINRTGLLLAAALVVAADALVLFQASQNRSGGPISTIDLTERELHLVRFQRDSTALFLKLEWEPSWAQFKFENGPGWFDRGKLQELGYDCRLSLTDPAAPAHYRALPSRTAFAVLEYRPELRGEEVDLSRSASRLVAVDAALDLAPLRQKYPDPQRFLIVPSLVMLRYTAKWDPLTRSEAPGAYLRGVVAQLVVGEIYVPPPLVGILASLKQPTLEYLRTPEAKARGPRFAAVVAYGRNHEPWIESCRLLAAAPGAQ